MFIRYTCCFDNRLAKISPSRFRWRKLEKDARATRYVAHNCGVRIEEGAAKVMIIWEGTLESFDEASLIDELAISVASRRQLQPRRVLVALRPNSPDTNRIFTCHLSCIKQRIEMEGLYFNVNGGYVEGIVRGYRNTLLTGSNYGNLTQCESIDDIKMQLGPAYGDALQSLPPNPSTSALADKTTEKLVQDFRYLQGQATGSLAKFMQYLTYSYMIDNVALLITGTLHERDTKELLERCHPLGWFETMPVLCVATNIEELYNSVLIETPLAPFFKGHLSHQDLDELNIEIVRGLPPLREQRSGDVDHNDWNDHVRDSRVRS